MYCDHCGNDIADDSVFCKHCGKTVSTAQTPPVSQKPAKSAEPAKEPKKKANIWLVLLVMAVVYAAAYLIGENVFAPALKTPTPIETAERPEITITAPEKQDFDLIPDTSDASNGSQRLKIFKLSGDAATIKYTIAYCEGTYNGSPDDTVLSVSYETELNRSYDVDSHVSNLYKGIYAVQEHPNFDWRENNSEYYYNIDLYFEDLGSPDSANLIPNLAALCGLGTEYSGSTLKMSDVEASLLSRDYIITYAD